MSLYILYKMCRVGKKIKIVLCIINKKLIFNKDCIYLKLNIVFYI